MNSTSHTKSSGRSVSSSDGIIQGPCITVNDWKCKVLPQFEDAQRKSSSIFKTWEPLILKCFKRNFLIIGCFHKVDKSLYSVKIGVCKVLESHHEKNHDHDNFFEAKIESFVKGGSTVSWKGRTSTYMLNDATKTSILDCYIARCVDPSVTFYISIKSENRHQSSLDEKWLEIPFKATNSLSPFLNLEIKCFQCMETFGKKSKLVHSCAPPKSLNKLADKKPFDQSTGGNHWKERNFKNPTIPNLPKKTLAYKFEEFKSEAIKTLCNIKPDTLEESASQIVYLYYKNGDIKRTSYVSNLIYQISVESEYTANGGMSLVDYANMILYIKNTDYGISRNIVQGIIQNCRASFEGRHEIVGNVDFDNVYARQINSNRAIETENTRFTNLCGNIQLIAELFNRQLILMEAIYSCIWTLARSQVKVDHYYLAKLVRSVGMNLEYLILYPNAENETKHRKITIESLNSIYSKLWSFVQDSTICTSLRLDFLEICEERERRWRTVPNLEKLELYKETREKLEPNDHGLDDDWKTVSSTATQRKKGARRKCKSESDKQSNSQIQQQKQNRKVSFAFVERRKPELHADKQFNLLFDQINTKTVDELLDSPNPIIQREFSNNLVKRLEIISQKFMEERKWEMNNIKWLHC